jgi:5-methylcytosine-specific restriction endonuclease McrA
MPHEGNISPSKRGSRHIKKKDREDVVNNARKKGQDAYGWKLKPGDKIDVDHIKPHAKGGSNDRDNLQALRASVNRAKGDRNDKSARRDLANPSANPRTHRHE